MGPFVQVATMIRDMREQAAWTQQELADRSGLSLRALSNLECGRVQCPRVHTLRDIAKALGFCDEETRRFVRAVRAAAGTTSRGLPMPYAGADNEDGISMPKLRHDIEMP